MDVAKSCLTFWLVREIFFFCHTFFFNFFFRWNFACQRIHDNHRSCQDPGSSKNGKLKYQLSCFPTLLFRDAMLLAHFFFQLVNVGPPWDDLLSFLLLYNFACFLKSPWELLLLEPFTRGWDVCLFPPICGHFYFLLQRNTIALKIEIVN